MRVKRFAFVAVAVTTSLAAVVACGGSNPPSQTPTTAGPAASAGDTSAPPGAGDAGPPSTTTQTLTGGGGATKLTPLASADAGTDGGHVKHQAEIGRSVSDIRAILGSRRDEARACYDNAVTQHPGIEGTIDIRWTIDPAGVVTEADIDTSHSEMTEPAVANCIIAMVKKIHFNASPKGFETKAHYPFNFHPRTHHDVMGDGNH
jgi:ABC-type transport system substrate-binding protein